MRVNAHSPGQLWAVLCRRFPVDGTSLDRSYCERVHQTSGKQPTPHRTAGRLSQDSWAGGVGAYRRGRLVGERVTLRPIEEADRTPLRSILAEPGVARWWGTGSPEEAVADLYEPFPRPRSSSRWTAPWWAASRSPREDDPDYRHAGIDLFLATACQGRGLGPEALRLAARYLFEVRGHHRLTIDPAAANTRAIRAYERVGFRPVGVMRQYERGRDGTWHDGLLMDLLAGELLRV